MGRFFSLGWLADDLLNPSMTSDQFITLLPETPYAGDVARFQRIFSREQAVTKRLVQLNHPLLFKWLSFDIDREDAYFAAEERFAYDPTFISVNRENGHAHASYLVAMPVSLFEKSHREPIRLFRDVQRGLQKRLGADPAYSGHLTKNPLHPHWETHWQAKMPYDLVRLADSLDKSDKSRTRGITISIGRNCSLFDRIRQDAYREVLPFKRANKSEEDFRETLEGDAFHMNGKFSHPLTRQEVKGIAKSVSKWVWDKFSDEKFSAIQTRRINRRWKDGSLSQSKPWNSEGISRATWYRRQRAPKALLS